MDIQRVETYMKRVAESETKTFTPVGDQTESRSGSGYRIHRNGGAG